MLVEKSVMVCILRKGQLLTSALCVINAPSQVYWPCAWVWNGYPVCDGTRWNLQIVSGALLLGQGKADHPAPPADRGWSFVSCALLTLRMRKRCQGKTLAQEQADLRQFTWLGAGTACKRFCRLSMLAVTACTTPSYCMQCVMDQLMTMPTAAVSKELLSMGS